MLRLSLFLTAVLTLTGGSPRILVSNKCLHGLWFYIQQNPLTPPQYERAAVWLEPGSEQAYPVPLNEEGFYEWAAGAGFFSTDPKGCEAPEGVPNGSFSTGYSCSFLNGLHSSVIEWYFNPLDRVDLEGTLWFDLSNVQGISSIPVQIVPVGPGIEGPEQDPTCRATGVLTSATEEMCPVHPVYGSLWDPAKKACVAECDACRMHYTWLTGPEQDDPEVCGKICCPGSTMSEDACFSAGLHQNNEYSWMAKCAGSNLNYAFALDGWEGDHRCRHMPSVSLEVTFCPSSPQAIKFDRSFSSDPRTSQTGACVPAEEGEEGQDVFTTLRDCTEVCVEERRSRFNGKLIV